CNSVNRCVNRCVIVVYMYSFQFIVPKRVARVAKQFTARTIGGVTFFVEDDIENYVFVCGSRWFVYVPGLVVHVTVKIWFLPLASFLCYLITLSMCISHVVGEIVAISEEAR